MPSYTYVDMQESENLNHANGMISSPVNSIMLPVSALKTEYAKKLKTMKKKFFVLLSYDEHESARLVYFDSEKKWLNNSPPKRKIYLNECFSINSHTDAKQRHGISLYTTDDCFTIIFDNESTMTDWLHVLVELQNSDPVCSNRTPLPKIERVWQVTVKNKGLGCNKAITGVHRLCLTAKQLTLMKIGSNQLSPDNMEFPLLSIRRCGHLGSLFFMELGRSAVTGAGELWMQTDGITTAKNMHDTILIAMKSSGLSDESSSASKIRSRRSTNSVPNFNESAALSSCRSASGLYRHDLFENQPTAFRTRTVSEGQHSLTKEGPKRLSLGKMADSFDRSSIGSKNFLDDVHVKTNALPLNSCNETNLQNDSCSKSDLHFSFLGSSLYQAQSAISEENETSDEYLPMDPFVPPESDQYVPMDCHGGVVEPLKLKAKEGANLVETTEKISLGSPKFSTGELSELEDSHVEMSFSSSRSPAPSQSSIDETPGYLFMGSGNSVQCSSPLSDGYLSMSGKSSVDKKLAGYQLDKVQSFISDFSDCDDMPIRSYSVGATAKSNLIQDHKYRTRALSCGSQDDAAKGKLKKRFNMKSILRSSSKESNEAGTDDAHVTSPTLQTYGGSRQEDLMEMEFLQGSVSSAGSWSSSYSSASGRSRSGSKSSSSRHRSQGNKQYSCDVCQMMAGCTCPIDRPPMSREIPLATNKNIDGNCSYLPMTTEILSNKISPSQELVQQHFMLEISDGHTDETSKTVEQPKDNDSYGEYINIDINYSKPVNNVYLPQTIFPRTAASGTPQPHIQTLPPSQTSCVQSTLDQSCREYMNLHFREASPIVSEKKFEPNDVPKEMKPTVLSNAQLYPMRKQQSAPAGLPGMSKVEAVSPTRKTSCPVSSNTEAARTISTQSVDRKLKKFNVVPAYENVSFPSQHTAKSPFNSRPASVCNEAGLNYASLDLAATSEDDDRTASRTSSRLSTSTNSSSTNVSGCLPDVGECASTPPGFSYARIDFTRSEGLRTTTNTVVESRY